MAVLLVMVILHSMVKVVYYLEYGDFDQRLQKFSGEIEKIGVFRRYHIFLILLVSAVCQYAFGFGMKEGVYVLIILVTISLLQRILYVYNSYEANG
ncbi:MAG: hypothetical protein N2Z80_05010 [Hydrogenothermaceae bacterium]|nr:hypothetical protein [Hydrogenothermaceae bacterium]